MTGAAGSPLVRVLACGNSLRGDDGLAPAAVARLLPALPPSLLARLDVRCCEELRVEDLLDLAADTPVLLVDAVAGVRAGEVIVRRLDDLGRQAAGQPRSSHQLPLPTVLGLAGALRGRAVQGTFVGMGGERFAPGRRLSGWARAGLPAFVAAIKGELEALVASSVTMPPAPPG